ncbi:MAG: efflux RND transporter permease subunit, partial [Anaerolineae bacterium]
MNLSSLFIRRPIMTILAMLTLFFFGILSYQSLPVSDLPDVEYPTIQVTTSYPGANPKTMANNVTSPLELQFLTIDGLQTLSSTSTTGQASIVLQFALDKPIDIAAQDVQQALIAANPQLPQNLPYAPTYSKINPTATPILYLSISSPTIPLYELHRYGFNLIGQRISTLEGVSDVETYGAPFAVRIQVDPQKLAAKGIGIDEVALAIKNQNINDPIGVLYGEKKEFVIDADGQLDVAEKYESLIIKNKEGSVVRIRDVGRALDSLHDDKFSMKYTDQTTDEACVILAVRKLPGGNTLKIIQEIDKLLPSLLNELPSSIKFSRVLDMSVFIKEAVSEVKATLLIAIALVIVIIFIYLGKVVETIIPALAIPISLLGTFIVMYVLGFTINIFSLLAMTLSIGFLVDDAIVVLENVTRHVEMGKSPFEASLIASKEISVTILSMTICLASVFIPLLFMGGVIGRLFHQFAFTIVTAVLFSGFISLSLTPMLCSRFILKTDPLKPIRRIQRFSNALNTTLVNLYRKSLHWSLRHPSFVLAGGAICLIATFLFFKLLPREFLPGNDVGAIQGFTQANDDTSPFQMERYQESVIGAMKDNPDYHSIVSVTAGSSSDNEGLFFINLKPDNERPSIKKIIDSLYGKVMNIPGVNIFMRPVPLIDLDVGTTTSKGDYQYTLQSLNPEELYNIAPIMFEKMHQLD